MRSFGGRRFTHGRANDGREPTAGDLDVDHFAVCDLRGCPNDFARGSTNHGVAALEHARRRQRFDTLLETVETQACATHPLVHPAVPVNS